MARNIYMPIIPPRPYQLDAYRAYDSGIRKMILSWNRRSGKDVFSLSLLAREALKVKGSYWVIAPTQKQCQNIFIDSGGPISYIPYNRKRPMTTSGSLMEKCIPKELISKYNKNESRLTLVNGSTITFTGAESENFVGSNMSGVVLSELSLHKTNTFGLLGPIINESGCFLICNGTQRTYDNHLWEILQNTKGLENWYSSHLTARDTKTVFWIDPEGEFIINPEMEGTFDELSGLPHVNLQNDIDAGMSTRPMTIREYLNEPTNTEEGAYFADEMRHVKDNNMVNDSIVWDASQGVFTSWDLGLGDLTTICFFQYLDGVIKIIDYYENKGKRIDHYIDIVNQKPYVYWNHMAPHDVNTRAKNGDPSIADYVMDNYDFRFDTIPKTSMVIADIEVMREKLIKTYFNGKTTKKLLAALQGYHEASNGKPIHCDRSDSYRYCCMGIEAGMAKNVLAYQDAWSPFGNESSDPIRCASMEEIKQFGNNFEQPAFVGNRYW